MQLMTKDEALAAFRNRQFDEFSGQDRELVSRIVTDVRSRGDAAVGEYTKQFDDVDLEDFRVPPAKIAAAHRALDADLLRAIRHSISRVAAFYARQAEADTAFSPGDGTLDILIRPLERVACYVPGGAAPLFSSLIMTAVPARAAGVNALSVATPPDSGGHVAAAILAVAHELGISEVYRIGGAQAIAALAYGTASVGRADKIVGPGNRFVVLAKQLVYGHVGIEALPGPTETLIIADESAAPAHVIADLLAQAEHSGAVPVLVSSSERVATAVQAGLDDALAGLPTRGAARESLAERGVLVLVESTADALEVANAFAPEHLCLLVTDPESVLPHVRHAGGIFVGHDSMEALGDYMAGPSHVMPTGGSARFSSFVNLRDFQRLMPVVTADAALLHEIGPDAALLARAEGLEAHARAIEARLPGAGRKS